MPSHGRLSAPVVKAVGLAFILGPTLPPIQSAALETTRKCARGVIFGKNRYVLFCADFPSHPQLPGAGPLLWGKILWEFSGRSLDLVL